MVIYETHVRSFSNMHQGQRNITTIPEILLGLFKEIPQIPPFEIMSRI